MKTTIRRVLLSAVLVASATTVWAFMAAPIFDTPIGPYCYGAWEFQIYSLNGEFQFTNPVNSSGTPVFGETKVVRKSGQLPYVQRAFSALEGRGQDPQLGTITWTVDRERQAAAEAQGLITKVTARQTSNDLPATADIRFFVEARISSQPNRVYKSATQVRFVSSNITSYPFRNEGLLIAEPVDFYDSQTKQLVFRIASGRGTATSE